MHIRPQPYRPFGCVSTQDYIFNMDRALPDQSLPESAPSLDVFPGTEIMLGPNSANDRSAGIV